VTGTTRLTSVADHSGGVSTITELEPGDDLATLLPPVGPAVLYFHQEWSAPCVRMATLLGDLDPAAPVLGVDADDHPTLANDYGVGSVPALVFLRNREVVGRHAGLPDREELADVLDEYV
jgi:thioredoxin 1